MPELPEIETIKLQLRKYLVGQEIDSLIRLHPKSVQGDIASVKGKKITGVERRGKMLVLDLGRDLRLAIHFKMSGQLILVKSKKLKVENDTRETKKRIVGGHPTGDWVGKLPSKHTRAIFRFRNGDTLYFNDQRIFGWIEINSNPKNQNSKMQQYLEHLGPEPWDISDNSFYELIHKRKKAIKLVLMDQTIISGVGNIYANDGLWEAQISPRTPASKLTPEQCTKLRRSLVQVLREGIKYGGATAPDAKYIDLNGLGGHYQEHFRTYDRQGQACLRHDGGIIKKIALGSRGTYFCPVCQQT